MGRSAIHNLFTTKSRFLELSTLVKEKHEKENPTDWSTTITFAVFNFSLSVGIENGPDSEEMTYYDFIIKKKKIDKKYLRSRCF